MNGEDRHKNVLREMGELVNIILAEETEKGKFLAFSLYCVERLNKGDQVQEIWRDYLAKEN